MSTELALPVDLPLAPANVSNSDIAALMTSSFLPRIQVMGGNNDIVKEGKFPIGHFALVNGKDYDDLGDQFIAVVVAYRLKAMQFQPDIISYYDSKSESFAKIRDRADNETNSGCGYGPEFLLWLPDKEKFATFFCANATARREAPNILASMRKVCLFQTTLITSKKFKWHGPKVSKCDAEVAMPEETLLLDTVTTFVNPPHTEVEVAKEADKSEVDR